MSTTVAGGWPPSPANDPGIRKALPADYIVYKDSYDSKYHAVANGSLGLPGTDYSGSNAGTVIQNAINALNTAGGGSIYFKPGTYPCQLTFIDVNNITLKGVYNQSIIQNNANSGVAVAIGNQNATDGNYHSQNIVVEDLVIDGGSGQGFTTAQNLRITTAFNVLINRCTLQGSNEVATGCGITNWNATQILSKNIWWTNNYHKNQKVTISGVTNTWWMGNVFDGVATPNTGRALIDFSKGDISPLTTNRVTNGHFDYNMIYGWTQSGGGIQGLQSISSCSISHNNWNGLSALVGTVDATAPYDLFDLTIEDNNYVNCTGGMSFGYGDRIRIIKNRLNTDSTPANQSTAITVLKTANGVIPTNVEVEDNLIFKWGGLGIYPSFVRGSVKRNHIIDCNQGNGNANSLCGILIGDTALSLVDFSDNFIHSTVASGAGQSRPINYQVAAQNIRFLNNNLKYTAIAGSPFNFAVSVDPTVVIRGNIDYNPQAASNVTAGTSPWTYTNNDAYDEIMVLNNLNGGSISAISYRGDAGYPTTVNGFAFFLQPQQTIQVTWATTAPTFRKYPQ